MKCLIGLNDCEEENCKIFYEPEKCGYRVKDLDKMSGEEQELRIRSFFQASEGI